MGTNTLMNELLRHIDAVRKKQIAVYTQTSFWWGLLLLIGMFFLFSVAEALGNFSAAVRTVLFFLLLVGSVAITGWYWLRPLLIQRRILPWKTDEAIANEIGRKIPQIRDKFLNMYQLSLLTPDVVSSTSPQLIAAALRSFLEEIKEIDFPGIVATRPAQYMRKRFFLTACCVAGMVAVFPATFSSSFYRLVHFRQEFVPPPPFSFVILPGNKEVVRGDTVTVMIGLQPLSATWQSYPQSIVLSLRQEHQEVSEERILTADSTGIFRTTFAPLRATTMYKAVWKNVESEEYALTVLDRPLLRSFHVRIVPPHYTKLPSTFQEEFVGDISALPGTIVHVEGSASKPLSRMRVLFSDSAVTGGTVKGYTFHSSFMVRRAGAYAIELQDESGLTNSDPVWYRLTLLSDEIPTVAILEPGKNIDIADNRLLPLRILAKDDYGFSSLQLAYRLVQSRFEQPQSAWTYISLPVSTDKKECEVEYLWQLSPLHLVPEDVVEYYVQVFDNDNVQGPKKGQSQTYLLRLPSLEEVFADIGKEQQQSLETLGKAQEEAKRLKREIDALNRELKQAKTPNWQMQKKAEEVAKRYEELQKQVEETRRRLEQATQTMEQQNVLSEQTLEKYLELQELLSQINSEELQQLLRSLQTPSQTLDPQRFQQLVQQLTMNEERFRQSIERTIELLKRLQIEQKLDEVRKRADEIFRQQQELKEAATNASSEEERNALALKQRTLAKEEQALEREMEELQKRMEEFFTEMPADKMAEVLQQLQEEQLSRKMNEHADSLQQAKSTGSQRMQQQILQSLENLKQQLSAMQQQMLQNQTSYVLSELRRAMYSTLQLSQEQEQLRDQARGVPYGSQQLRDNAVKQAELRESLQNLVQSLYELSKKSFVITPEMGKIIGEAFGRMQSAVQELEERNGVQASKHQSVAMELLNRAAVQFHRAMQSMMQQGGGGGGMSLMRQLQQMAEQQMALNMQTQRAGSGAGSEEARRLAQQQEGIRKSVEQLMEEARRSMEHERLARELSRIEEEMKEVVQQLQQNEVNPETLQKQERILSRLLDASRSMRERDYEQRRRAERGEDRKRQSPPELSPTEPSLRTRYQEEILKAQELRYAKEYQELIKKYFDALEKIEKLVH